MHSAGLHGSAWLHYDSCVSLSFNVPYIKSFAVCWCMYPSKLRTYWMQIKFTFHVNSGCWYSMCCSSLISGVFSKLMQLDKFIFLNWRSVNKCYKSHSPTPCHPSPNPCQPPPRRVCSNWWRNYIWFMFLGVVMVLGLVMFLGWLIVLGLVIFYSRTIFEVGLWNHLLAQCGSHWQRSPIASLMNAQQI